MSSRRRVEKVTAVSAMSPSATAEICFTTSITSDPENTWIAKRQSAITAALERRSGDQGKQINGRFSDFSTAQNRAQIPRKPEVAVPGKEAFTERLSGESERIGKGDWAESTPFGKHVGYL